MQKCFSFFEEVCRGEKIERASAHRCHVVYIDVIFPLFSLSPPITSPLQKAMMKQRNQGKENSAGNFLVSLLISSFNFTGGKMKRDKSEFIAIPS
jgi:hypothetical protein